MKKLLGLVLTCACTASLYAETWTDEAGVAWAYTKRNQAVTITGCSNHGAEIVIPAEIDATPVTTIGKLAFRNKAIEALTVPASVTTIEESAFKGCTELTTITLNEGLTSIGESAFSNTGKVDIPGALKLTLPASLQAIGNGAFRNNKNLGEVTLLAPVGAPNLFADCTSLTSVALPEGLTVIYDNTFNHCRELTTVNIPSTVTVIGRMAFNDCVSLSAVTIPAATTKIEKRAFAGCPSLVEITFNEGLQVIKESAFGATGKVDMPGALKITLPASLRSIENGAFRNNKNLGEVTLLAPVGAPNLFADCTSLTSVTLPEGLTNICDYTFNHCRELTTVNIPSTVTTIGKQAFSDCRALETVTLPAGVKKVTRWPFEKTTTVHVSGTTLPAGCTPSGTIVVPAGDTVWTAAAAKAKGTVTVAPEAPAAEETAPTEEAAPEEEAPAPAEEAPAPVEEAPAPVEEAAAPAEEVAA